MAKTTEEHDMETLIWEQKKELMAAKSIDSDMIIAYNLQLQEAINVSSLSSSSTATSTTTIFEEDAIEISDILMSEIEKYEQERSDYEIFHSEMKRAKHDLGVRLHDGKFANEISRISDEEWVKNGDNIKNPYDYDKFYGEEWFRLYFKGIFYNELAAIGVAICDSEDKVIFEVSKPVVVDRDGEMSSGGDKVGEVGGGGGGSVEFEALIEGLNCALSLDLKRVVYYCDNLLFHQYVSGKSQPDKSNISNLVTSVTLLHERFLNCDPLLVAPTEIKFAFKLARASISAQLTKLSGTSGKDVITSCSMCHEDTNVKLMFMFDDCGHQYCSFCIKQLVEVKLQQGELPKCPFKGCSTGIKADSCQKFLEPKLFEILSQRVKEATIPDSEKVYCPSPNCSVLMSRSEIMDFNKKFVVKLEEPGASRCVKCQRLLCVDCKVPWHSSVSCAAFRHFRSNASSLDVKLKSVVDEKRWRQCPKCKDRVVVAEDCERITCRCGHEFCFNCGAEWKDENLTCSCKVRK